MGCPKEYYEANRDKILEQHRLYYQTNRQRFLEKAREYHLKNKEKRCASSRRYRSTHRDYYLAKNREYYRANRENIIQQARLYNGRADVKLRSRLNRIRRTYGETILEWYKKQDGHCIKCGERERINVHHIDLDRGNNSASNLVLLCNSCHTKFHRFQPNPVHLFQEWLNQ